MTKYKHGWKRHPLVFLMEAADDICYRLIDVEDAFKLNRLSFNEAEGLLRAIFPSGRSYSPEWDEGDTISWLRAKAIRVLVKQVSETVVVNLPALMAEKFSEPLIERIQAGPAVEAAYNTVKKRVFAWDRTVSAEIAGAQMITDVLERLILAVESPASYKNEMLLKIVPHYKDDMSTYARPSRIS